MPKLNIGGVMEEVVTSEEFTLQKAQKVLKDETVAVIGYGVQGRGQALNMRNTLHCRRRRLQLAEAHRRRIQAGRDSLSSL